tara:strand:+ start:320 stop:508 length:189 start_codon:yes stop_codon:yes gene_type:complete
MKKIPAGTTHLDTVDGACKAVKVSNGIVYTSSYYNWQVTAIPVSEVTLDNHYIEVAAHYGIE